MSDLSDQQERAALRNKVIGLGERSLRKNYYAELQRSLRALEEKDRAIRQAYSDVIDAVTGGRLILLGKDELDELTVTHEGDAVELRDPAELGEARGRVEQVVGSVPELADLTLAFSEGATNMLKHAGGGTYRIAREDGCVKMLLADEGHGIDFRHLPKATLVPGYSSKQTLGMGFTLMMELMDRVLLATDASGTTLILEKDLERAPAQEPLVPALQAR